MKREVHVIQRAWNVSGVTVWDTVAIFDTKSAAEDFLKDRIKGPRPSRLRRAWVNAGPIPSDRAVTLDDT